MEEEIIKRLERIEQLLINSGTKLSFNSEEAAREIGISVLTLNDFRRRGLIQGFKVGKSYCYSRKAIEEFLDENKGKNLTKNRKKAS